MNKNMLTIKETAKLLEISTATVNYYTHMGLLRVSKRKGNSRMYDKKDTLDRFYRIKDMRNKGYSLALIQRNILEESLSSKSEAQDAV